mgnify:CR=1 FL=1
MYTEINHLPLPGSFILLFFKKKNIENAIKKKKQINKSKKKNI